MFSYPSLKNGNEDEQHEGHKSFVFSVGSYMFAYIVHSDLATQHRFFARVHSGGFIVTDAKSGAVLAKVIQKVDFGALKVRVGGYTNSRGQDINSHTEYVHPEIGAQVEKDMQGVSDRSILINIVNGNVRSRFEKQYTYRVGNFAMVSSACSLLPPNTIW
jgi:hypothetical protein